MNDQKIIDALNKYYKFKLKYDKKYNKSKNLIKMDDSLSFSSKKNKIKALKPQCIKCKRKVGTIFYFKDRTLTAKCGDTGSPCPLDIRINKGSVITEYDLANFWQNEISKDKEEIIVTKLNFLFKFVNEETSITKFNELKERLKETIEEYTVTLNAIDYIINNPEKKELLNKSIISLNEYLKIIKDTINKFNESNNTSLIHDAIEIYINNVLPLQESIRNIKYQYMNVEYDETDDVYKLIKLPISTISIERTLEDPTIIAFKI